MKESKKLGEKYDDGKLLLNLLPPYAEEKIAEVLTFGANKYEPDGWRYVEKAEERYLAACMRHILAYRKGLKQDDESGLSHLAHAACCLMFLLELEE